MPSSLTPFSVIIPVRNGASTLSLCIQSILESSLKPAEIIMVDDGSTDTSAEIALSLGCRVMKVSEGKGPMQPRFAGARAAVNPLLVFIDSDVCVDVLTFERLVSHFIEPGVSAVTGLLSRSSREPGFFSSYKNEYMNYLFSGRSSDAGFLYGSIFAVLAGDFIYFEPVNEPFGCLVSDSELGMRLKACSKRIILDHSLEVEHLKRYSLASLLRNDFVIPFMFARIFPRYAQGSSVFNGKAFSHASWAQTLSAAACAAAWALLFLGLAAGSPSCLIAAFVFASLFFLYWRGFIFRTRERGYSFAAACSLMLIVDAPVMLTGMFSGFFYNGYAFLKGLLQNYKYPSFRRPAGGEIRF